ncbi:MAG: GNAT family N-acetyltransferase [Fimbriimonadaceae bacterium]|nr:GNAT family N-acetyltransferase [Alphaproteobacteria bacterium]
MSKIEVRAVSDGPDQVSDLSAVQDLCRSFRTWLYQRYRDDHASIDAYYDPQQYEQLLGDLPALHAPPGGAILLAKLDGEPAGCVMLSRFDCAVCEMKRLFVAPEYRGRGVAGALCGALFVAAKQAGYRIMRLDTGPFHHEAKALYGKLGFFVRDAYYDPGPEWRNRLVFMECKLTEDGE